METVVEDNTDDETETKPWGGLNVLELRKAILKFGDALYTVKTKLGEDQMLQQPTADHYAKLGWINDQSAYERAFWITLDRYPELHAHARLDRTIGLNDTRNGRVRMLIEQRIFELSNHRR